MGEYWIEVIYRAATATFQAIGQTVGAILFTALTLGFGLAFAWRRRGTDAMRIDLQTFLDALPAVALAWVVIFVWHFVAIPYRIYREGLDRESNANTRVGNAERDLADERDKSKPRFIGSIVFVLPDVMPPNYGASGTAIVVGASVANTGAPSVAVRWRLTVQLSNGESVTLTPEVVPQRLTVKLSSGASMVIEGANALYEKVSNKPVGTGYRESGPLFFLAPTLETSEARKLGTKYTLSFQDINSREWNAEMVLSAPGNPNPKYFPGITSLPQ
jgi:hypothetical protein